MKHKPKKLLSGLLAAAMMLSAAPFGMLGGEQPTEMNIPGISKAKASDAEEEVKLVEVKAEDVLTFEIVDGEAYVTNCAESANGNKLVIPSVYDGCPVTIIFPGAFSDCGWIVDVTVPEGVTDIFYSAFEDCSNLKTVRLPDSLKSIHADSFSGCRSLLSLNIPAGVEAIEMPAFPNNSWDRRFSAITVDDRNGYFSSVDGVLYSKDMTELVCYPYGKTETSYKIPDGVTGIYDCAFYHCDNLTTIDIPSSVNKIGSEAFRSCGALTSISIPQGVTELSDSVFMWCSSLISVDLPQSITNINSRAFYYCDNLLTITLPSELKCIFPDAFYGSGLTKISIPASVEYISSDAFEGCSALAEINVDGRNTNYCDDNGILFNKSKTEIICYPAGKTESGYAIPSSVNTISSYAFYGCKSLKEIKIPEGVTSIGYSAFSGCESLESVNIPSGVTTIEDYTFFHCKSLKEIKIPDGVTSIGSSAFSGCESLESVNIPSEITSIEYRTFDGCKALKEVKIPDGVTSIGSNAFSYCESLESANIPSGVTTIEKNTFYVCKALKEVKIPDGVTSIGYSAFSYCESLESVNIPSGVTAIVDSTFSGCEALKEVKIPDGVISIGESAFHGCESIESINIPSGVTSIEYSTFSDCKVLKEIKIPDGVTSIGSFAFSGCESLESVNIPSGVTAIADSTFSGCKTLKEVKIPDGVTSIGGSAFHGCESLESVNIPSEITSIEYRTFDGCKALKEVKIPDGVTSIGESAFHGCESLESINIPSGVTSIEYSTFSDCKVLKEIKIPDGVTSIGESAFSDCESLESVNIPSEITSIEYRTFEGCKSLKEIKIPDSVISIGYKAFYECEGITNFDISQFVTEIQGSAFGYCRALEKITVDEANDNYCSDNGVLYDKNKTILLQYPLAKNEDSFTIPESVNTVYSDAFAAAKNLKSVFVGSGVADIEYNAFADCDMLTNIAVDANNSEYCSDNGVLFDKNKSVIHAYPAGKEDMSYSVPDSVCTISEDAFCGNKYIETLNVPEKTDYIEAYTFANCINLKKINVAENNPYLCSENGIVFNKEKNSLYIYPAGRTESSYVVSADVDSVSWNVFDYAPALKHVYFMNRTCWPGIHNKNITIHGFAGSSAEIFANEYGFVFEEIKCDHSNTVIVPAVPATCIEMGLTEGIKCAACGLVLKEQTETPLVAHRWDNGVVTVQPAIGVKGNMLYTCTVCHMTVNEDIPALSPQDITVTANDTVKPTGSGAVAVVKDVKAAELLSCSNAAAVLDKDNNAVPGDAPLATGMKLVLNANGQTVEKQIVVMGDVNGDGEIAVADARLALRCAVGLESFSGVFLTAANVKGEDTVGVGSARTILRVAVGLETGKDLLGAVK